MSENVLACCASHQGRASVIRVTCGLCFWKPVVWLLFHFFSEYYIPPTFGEIVKIQFKSMSHDPMVILNLVLNDIEFDVGSLMHLHNTDNDFYEQEGTVYKDYNQQSNKL